MIKCKKCGTDNTALEPICQKCAAEIEISHDEARPLLDEALECMKKRHYERAVDIYRFLAAVGIPEGERELAKIIERGLLVPRDLDMAMKYFYSAALKGDTHSAYRYAKLISRANEKAAKFWIAYAALLDDEEAFGDACLLYDKMGDDESSSYYCARLALAGDVDATVEMARRHIYGKGVEKSEAIAKWYMETLRYVPVYASKLSFRLKAYDRKKEPAEPKFENRDRIIRALLDAARKMKFRHIVVKLSDHFSKLGVTEAVVSLATLYIEGIDFKKDVERGIALLKDAIAQGSSVAAKQLGDLYSIGEHVEKDPKKAREYYLRAAELCDIDTYEMIGDVFLDGKLTEEDPPLALALFEKGAELGNRKCAARAAELKHQREVDYFEGIKYEKAAKEEAFEHFAKAMKYGYLPTHAKIAPYYEHGVGTEKNRNLAFYHYKTAVEIGDKRALFDLGRCYANGIGTEFDFKKASKYLSMARELGQRGADEELRRIYENKKRHMTRSLYSTAMSLLYQKNYGEAMRLLEICSSFGYSAATYTIGCLYEFGIGRPANRRTALDYYKAAYALGYSDYDQSHKYKMLKMTK